jgi:ACS family hexuronate transporter-like MFS transporter
MRELLATRRFWAIAVPRFFAEPAWQTFSFWITLYQATERHMDLKQIALFAWMPSSRRTSAACLAAMSRRS